MSAALVGTLAASAAQAGTATVTPQVGFPIATSNASAHDHVNAVQQNVNEVTAKILNATISNVGVQTDDKGTPTVSSTSLTANANTIAAGATGNQSSFPTVDISLTETNGGTDDGIATLAGGFNFGAIVADVFNDDISNDYGDVLNGSITANNNTISADANGNTATSLVSGKLPGDFDSAVVGHSALTANVVPATDWLNVTGSLSASTIQVQDALPAIGTKFGPIVNEANADGNDRILLNVINTLADEATVSSPELDDNAISADVAGNSSNTTINVKSGGNPVFDGTAVVTNGQINNSPTMLGSHITSLADDAAIIATIAADDVNTSDDIELQGGLSVQGNTISTSASGNQALGSAAGQSGNQILIASGLSFAGADTTAPGTDTAYKAGSVTSTANADIVIHSSQGNVGDDDSPLVIRAYTHNGEIAGVVDDINGGSVKVTDNSLTADTRGNTASSAFASGTGMPSFAGSAAVANQQINYRTAVSSEAKGDIDARVSDDDDTPDSQVLVDSNSVASTTYGNSVTQSLSLDAVVQDLTLPAVTLTGGTDGATNDGNVSSDGSLTVTNLQANYDGTVTSRDAHNIYATASLLDGVTNSSVDVTNNTATSLTAGSNASNSLSLSGTTVGAGAGIDSVQIAGGGFTASAESNGTMQVNVGDLGVGDDDVGASVNVSGNTQQAIAAGNAAGNALSVKAQTITVDDTVANGVASTVTNTGGSLTTDPQPLVVADYGVLNIQSLDGAVSATAIPASYADNTAFLVTTGSDDVDGDVVASSITNGGSLVNNVLTPGNTLSASAYGADATNSAQLDVGNLDSSNADFASVLNLTNAQEVTGRSSVTASILGGQLAETVVRDDVTDGSSVATSYNTAQASAFGNRAGNTVSVNATNIDTEADSFPTGIQGEARVDGGVATTEASFSLNNVQSVAGAVTASLLNNAVPASATASLSVLTEIGDDVTDSAISSDFNSMSASGTGNRANNAIGVTGTGLATTVALTNYQIDPTNISALVGKEGGVQNVLVDPGTPDTPFTYNSELSISGSSTAGGFNVTGIQDVIYIGSNPGLSDPDVIAELVSEGWTFNAGPNTLTRTNTDGSLTHSGFINTATYNSYVAQSNPGNGTLDDGTDPTFADVYVPGSGGVTVQIHGDIDPSSVSVNNNSVSGAVTGNSATNAASLVGVGVADGSDHLLSYGVVTDTVDTAFADADVMAVNRQTVTGGTLDSEVFSTFAIDTDNDATIEDSGLTVDGNKQSSQAIANTADNSVKLGATNTAAGSALMSVQDSAAEVTATSGMTVFAPVVSSGSSISMSGNTNSALAVQNNVSNTLTVDATNASFVSDVFPIDGFGGVDDTRAAAFGDHVLLNEQLSTDDATATAFTNIFNDDSADPATLGLLDGSVTVSGNSTKAQAAGNLADNLANVGAAASLTASAALTNSQANSGAISADATTNASVTINGDDLPLTAAINGSSITLGSNTTSAKAQGNAATNVLNYTAGASYGAGAGNAGGSTLDVLALPFAFGETVSAQAAVLNFQGNSGAVSATSADASYLVALNTNGGSPVVTSATVNVIGNSLSASAYGNSATNVITANALNTDRPTLAIGNYQTNSGPVMATVTSVTYGVTTGLGAVTGSSIGVNGNSITATAVGNSATSSIVTGH